MMAKECGDSFLGDENVLKLTMMMNAQFCEYSKSYRIVYFKWISKLYLNKAVKNANYQTPKPLGLGANWLITRTYHLFV